MVPHLHGLMVLFGIGIYLVLSTGATVRVVIVEVGGYMVSVLNDRNN